MILNAEPWKRALQQELDHISAIPSEELVSNIGLNVQIDHFFFWSAFVIRKLTESNCVTSDLVRGLYPVRMYPRLHSNEVLDELNYGDLNYWFDLERELDVALTLKDVCNIIIHSFVFQPDVGASGVEGLIVTSDRTKAKGLYQIEHSIFGRMMRDVIDDNPRWARVDRHGDKSTVTVFDTPRPHTPSQ